MPVDNMGEPASKKIERPHALAVDMKPPAIKPGASGSVNGVDATEANPAVPVSQQLASERYTLCNMRNYDQMKEIVEVIWTANYDPYDPIIRICMPTDGYGSSDRDKSLEDATKRFWQEQAATVGCFWSYVEEKVTKEIVGCCQLVLYDSYEPTPPKAPWWLSKEPRQFSELILGRIYQARRVYMKKKRFIAVNWLAVLPEHRRKGVGKMLMQEAIRLADEFELATWLEASLLGKPLYQTLGFRDVAQVDLDTTQAGQTDSWRRCQHELTPGPISCMWRPVQGVWEADGKQVKLPSETIGVEEEGVGEEL